MYRDELVPRLQHIQNLNSALHSFLQKTCVAPTNVSTAELEQFQEKVKDSGYFYETIAMLSTHMLSIRVEMQQLGAQVEEALLLTDFSPKYLPQWDIEKRTPHPLTAAITNASRDTAHLPASTTSTTSSMLHSTKKMSRSLWKISPPATTLFESSVTSSRY